MAVCKNYFLVYLILLFLANCKGDPGFSLEPTIKFRNVVFNKGGSNASDIIRLELDFTDGDGNLGLSTTDTVPPYNPDYKNGVPSNPNYYNIDIQFMFRNPDSTYSNCLVPECNSKLDTALSYYDGRFPMLNPDGDKKPISGILIYDITSSSFSALLGGKVLKLRVRIQDKDLNKSNEIITDEFTIPKDTL